MGNTIELKSPEESAPDLLTELLRNEAKELISQVGVFQGSQCRIREAISTEC